MSSMATFLPVPALPSASGAFFAPAAFFPYIEFLKKKRKNQTESVCQYVFFRMHVVVSLDDEYVLFMNSAQRLDECSHLMREGMRTNVS